jgi:CheY-like chemotaxis protein
MAADGQEALEIVRKDAPDVIILDLEMPRMDGCAAAKAIRKHEVESGKRSFILGLTGYTRSESAPLCADAGMDDCLTKPARKFTLLAGIANYFSSGGVWNTLEDDEEIEV